MLGTSYRPKFALVIGVKVRDFVGWLLYRYTSSGSGAFSLRYAFSMFCFLSSNLYHYIPRTI